MAKQTILLIEDDDSMVSLLQTLLEIEGYRAERLPGKIDMEVILAWVSNEKPDLVLLDVNLRQLNGLDLIRRVRQDEQLKGLPVLMTSGMELSKECLQAGANGFILKPFMPDELIGKIRGLLPAAGL